jgi:hypothetical protein
LIIGLFSNLTVCGAPAMTAGDVRVFGRLDIMYHRLTYISGGIFGRLDIMFHRLHMYLGIKGLIVVIVVDCICI